jgi:uncharacterized protein YbjT (DUF2867 family)
MNVLLFGATGMVGQGVLRECLLDPRVTAVTTVVRRPTATRDAKFDEVVLPDLAAIDTVADRLTGFDAGLFCVGVTSAGMAEPAYTRLTYDLTLAVANALVARNPGMTFIYVSGVGADSTERGRSMWARVRGRTENALFRLPFKAVHVFRLGAVQPLHGIRSRTAWYRLLYRVAWPLFAVLGRVAPGLVTTTEGVGRAMIAVAIDGDERRILSNAHINKIAAS